MIDGHWLSVRRNDPRAFALYRRHYSAIKNMRLWRARETNFLGPGECLVLLSCCGRAVFAWQRNTVERYDRQAGVCCTLFRNEGAGLSSDLIREADELAWQRWPGERHFTYVDDAKIRRKRDPGRCFRRAGWRVCGRNADGRLTILERLPG
jgi:hypothetical protein